MASIIERLVCGFCGDALKPVGSNFFGIAEAPSELEQRGQRALCDVLPSFVFLRKNSLLIFEAATCECANERTNQGAVLIPRGNRATSAGRVLG